MDLNAIAKWAIKNEASDIHIKVGAPPKVRIDGLIQAIPKAPKVTQELPRETLERPRRAPTASQ